MKVKIITPSKGYESTMEVADIAAKRLAVHKTHYEPIDKKKYDRINARGKNRRVEIEGLSGTFKLCTAKCRGEYQMLIMPNRGVLAV